MLNNFCVFYSKLKASIKIYGTWKIQEYSSINNKVAPTQAYSRSRPARVSRQCERSLIMYFYHFYYLFLPIASFRCHVIVTVVVTSCRFASSTL